MHPIIKKWVIHQTIRRGILFFIADRPIRLLALATALLSHLTTPPSCYVSDCCRLALALASEPYTADADVDFGSCRPHLHTT